MSEPIIARFVDGSEGKLLVIARKPARPTAPGVLIVPPFAEEMNKSRHMLAEVARKLAARGVASVMPDLFGTGDSAGEFREARWSTWTGDLARVASWSASEGIAISAVLGVRLGCVLAADAAHEGWGTIRRSVFWQPVTSGERFIAQFLRLRVAASMMDAGQRESVGELRRRLGKDGMLEIAGYELSQELARDIEALQLTSFLGVHLGEIFWLDVVPSGAATSQAGAITDAKLKHPIRSRTIIGETFWNSTEIVRVAPLIENTVDLLSLAA